MTWTYSATDLSTDLARVRLMIGDTNTNDQQLSDEEIDFWISNSAGVMWAAAQCCRSLAAEYARRVDKSIGPASLTVSQRQKHYHDLALHWESQAARFTAIEPYAGGISVSDKDTVEGDSDRVTPSFAIGWDDNPGSQTRRNFGGSSS